MRSRGERERLWPEGINCLINLASGSLMNRLPAISYFPAVLNYKFRCVEYFNMLNITGGNSPEILTKKRGDGLFSGKWFCVGADKAVGPEEARLYSIDLYRRQAESWLRLRGLHFCRSCLTPETRTFDNTRLLLSLAAFRAWRYSSTESKI